MNRCLFGQDIFNRSKNSILEKKVIVKAELQAKFLQHLNQKKQDKGFTLIELLVVVIIIGILSAIALPTFLNQVAKAKQSEAVTVISSSNTAQTAYRVQHTQFALTFTALALGLSPNTNNYTYTVAGGIDTASIISQNSDPALKGYSGGAVRFVNTDSQSAITSIICEVNTPSISPPAPPSPLNPSASTPSAALGCPATETAL